jgi:hypothetical protein
MNIIPTNIINEEVSKFLKESFSHEDEHLKFRIRMENPSFHNFSSFSNDHDVDVTEHNIIVDWHVGFSINELGINTFNVFVDRVTGSYRVVLYNRQSDEVEQTLDKNIEETRWKFNIDDCSVAIGGSLAVTAMDFDFATNSCLVHFN